MKHNRFLAALIALVLVLSSLPLEVRAETIATGTCGEKLIWELSDQGVLTISGTGPMYDFTSYSNPVPWKEHRDDITAVVVSSGVTYIGSHAFESHKNLKTVDLPTGMTEIGAASFAYCDSLETIVIPEGVTKVGNDLFHSCRKLKMVVLPMELRWISSFMFYGCYELAVVVIPKSVYQINRDAFSECRSLWHILYTGKKSQWNRITIQDSLYGGRYLMESATLHYNCTGNEITDLANKECSICNAPCEHKWNDGVITEDPSCAAEGQRKYTCTLCGTIKTESIPKLDTHDFDYWKPFDNECHKRICHLCNIEETQEHVLDDCVITKEATCTEEGVKTYTCGQCRGTVTEAIAATGHSYGQWVQVKAPTYDEPGLEEQECDNCGIKGQRLLSKLEPPPTLPAPTDPEATIPAPEPTQPPVEQTEDNRHNWDGVLILPIIAVCVGGAAIILIQKKRE